MRMNAETQIAGKMATLATKLGQSPPRAQMNHESTKARKEGKRWSWFLPIMRGIGRAFVRW
jgi:hypothetical protein